MGVPQREGCALLDTVWVTTDGKLRFGSSKDNPVLWECEKHAGTPPDCVWATPDGKLFRKKEDAEKVEAERAVKNWLSCDFVVMLDRLYQAGHYAAVLLLANQRIGRPTFYVSAREVN